MNKISCTSLFYSLGSISLIGLFVLGGCAVPDTRYDDSTRKYSVAPNAKSVKYRVGFHEEDTAYYTSRPGNRSVPHSESIKMRAQESSMTTSSGGQQAGDMALSLDVADVLFEFDKSEIKSEFVPELNGWVEYFQKNAGETAVIYGHTDNIGNADYNQKLSEKRAQAVVDYMVQRGVDASRLTAQGIGASQPVAANETVEGRQKNRRVEMKK